MNVILWLVQIALAIVFAMGGAIKLMKPKEELREKMPWVDDFSQNTIRFIGSMELLAVVGLLIGGLLPAFGWATPFAALGLAALMVGAIQTHRKRNEPQMVMINVALLILSLFVFIGRLFILPF